MKTLFLIPLLLFAKISHAFVANCSATYYDDVGVSVASEQNILCKIGKLQNERFYYSLKIKTYGVDLDWTSDTIVLTCPTVSMKRLKKVIDKKGKWTVYDAQVSASLGVGVKAGVAVNPRGAVCTITGVTIGIGAAVGVGEMSLTPTLNNRWERTFEF